jgi:hypothetical protein
MSHQRSWTVIAVVIFGLVMIVPVAQAEREELEGILCHSNTMTIVQSTPGEIFVGSFEGKGINRITSTPSRDLSFHQVGTLKGHGGKWSWNGFSKALHPDGDFVIWEFSGDSAIGGSALKAIYGTGKYKGVKGEGKSTIITNAKPIVEGTQQQCQKFVGWVEFGK